MNLDRQRHRSAWTGKEAIDLALGRGRVPVKFLEAVSRTRLEAEELAFKVNTARKEKEAMAMLRGGGGGGFS